MPVKLKAIAAFAALMCFAASVVAHRGAERARPVTQEELLYLPNERMLTHFTAGMSSVIADLLWLRCVRYVAEETRGGRNLEWLEQMLHTVTRLDPHFVDAYRFGGLFMAALRAEDDAGLELLHRGIVRNPYAWELPNECAMIYLLNRRNRSDATQQAAKYLAMAVKTGRAPAPVADLASKIQGHHNMLDVEFEMWSGMAESDDQLLRELAKQKLMELKARIEAQQQRKPQ